MEEFKEVHSRAITSGENHQVLAINIQNLSCFIYNGSYCAAKDYLKRKKLSTLVIAKGSGDSNLNVPLRVNPLQLLNEIHIDAPIEKGLMHVQVLVNGIRVKVIMDSGEKPTTLWLAGIQQS